MNEMSPVLASGSTENVLGYSVEDAGIEVCTARVLAQFDDSKLESAKSRGRWLACINPHSYVAATRDPIYCDALRSADWLIPDGIGIALASRVLGGRIHGRVTGSDIFLGTMRAIDQKGGGRAFFLGSTEETLQRIKDRATSDYPNISVSSFSPPFKTEYEASDLDDMVERINSAKPDVLWVGLTAPKQEKLLNAIIDRIDVKFAAAIGAVFDFYAGTVKRSHPAFQRAGLEWLPRLLREPRRLWKRTFVSAPVFLWHVFTWRSRQVTNSDQKDSSDRILPPPSKFPH
jgi:N-acetylglucosaminyldiphosphoundecaprenol N-acetyl-beta-D-mannosaminyltransferase